MTDHVDAFLTHGLGEVVHNERAVVQKLKASMSHQVFPAAPPGDDDDGVHGFLLEDGLRWHPSTGTTVTRRRLGR